MGLATAHGIVVQSGGHIDVETTVGKGTAFDVCLPAAPGRPPVAAQPAFETARANETILLVEDQPEVRQYVAILLRACGYGVIECPDAETALAQCGGPIDLLLTDVVMPKVSGTELAAKVRAAQPGVRLLFMSGYSDEVLSWRSDSQGKASFIQKPFTPDALAAKIREILSR